MPRPPFNPTSIQRQLVAELAATGAPHESISVALGICRNTLERHFHAELASGRVRRIRVRFESIIGVFDRAARGNAAAAKAYLMFGTPAPFVGAAGESRREG